VAKSAGENFWPYTHWALNAVNDCQEGTAMAHSLLKISMINSSLRLLKLLSSTESRCHDCVSTSHKATQNLHGLAINQVSVPPSTRARVYTRNENENESISQSTARVYDGLRSALASHAGWDAKNIARNPSISCATANVSAATAHSTAVGSTEGANENFPVWDVFQRIPHISVSSSWIWTRSC
jgi:hypothetical protein